MANNPKYTKEQTEQAWCAVQRCINDTTEYNDNTQPILSVQIALKAVMDVLSNIHMEFDEKTKLYYDIYRALLLAEIPMLKKFDITFCPVGKNVTALQYIMSVAIFCYNDLTQDNAYQKGKDICGEVWAYKFSEEVGSYDSRAWASELLCRLPPEQAKKLMSYCYEKHKDHHAVQSRK